MNQLAQIHII